MEILTCKYVVASSIMSQDELNSLFESNNITWGDSNKCLITPGRIIGELDLPASHPLRERLESLPLGVYIDLEN